jgi:heat shock protein HtpX
MANILKTGFLLAVLTCLLVAFGGMLGGQQGLTIAFILAMVMNVGSYWFSDRIALAMSGAQPVSEAQAPELYGMVRHLAGRAGIPAPRVFVIPGDQPNAFATGRNPDKGVVAVTEGLMRVLDRDELAGVVAHELGHIKNRDTLTMTIAATLAGAITYMAHMAHWGAMFGGRRDDDEHGGSMIGTLALAIVAPIAAMLVQMAISRTREYEADATGARIAGSPHGLAGALQKLEMAARAIPLDASPATAHLYIVNPLSGGGIATLFSTHPPIAERIARLRALSVSGV